MTSESRETTILFVEDTLALLEEFPRVLKRRGHSVLAESHPDKVLELIERMEHIDLAVMDLQLPMDGVHRIGSKEAAGGDEAGLVLAEEFRRKFRRAPIIFWTGIYNRDVRSRALAMGNCRFIAKVAGPRPVLDLIDEALGGFRGGRRPKTFIVHGHDEKTMQSVRKFLQEALGFPEPIVLRDMPNQGKTVIEKLENHALTIDLAFVLLTPDDRVVPSRASGQQVYRSRQNVIFEMGYFLGVLGRNTGRVILLYSRPIELPSDIGGMISIDITDGIEAADEQIRRELQEWL